MQKYDIECNPEVSIETQRRGNFVQHITNKKAYELARAFSNALKVLKLHLPTSRVIIFSYTVYILWPPN